jgi:hypothetical protein
LKIASRRTAGLLALGVFAASAGVLVAPFSASAADTSWTPGDGTVSWTVPAGVCSVAWTLQGGAGGGLPGTEGGGAPGGFGGVVGATMNVTAGNQFTIQVGAEGSSPTGGGGTGAGGLSGGVASGGSSSGPAAGGGGGGATVVRAGGATAAPLLMAGGGGGVGVSTGATGGAAGTVGVAGGAVTDPVSTGGSGGTAATEGAGGITSGGAAPVQGQPGVGFVGGVGASGAGGGGGGSLAGGGGASNKARSFYTASGAGGGGGANYIASTVTTTADGTATTTADGSATVSTTACPGELTPSLNTATSVGGGQVSLGFSFTGDDSTVTGAQYSVDGGANWVTFTATRTSAGVWTGTVSGLTPGTYTIEIRATGALDPSSASNTQTVVIPGIAPTPRVLPAGDGLYAISCDSTLPNGQLLSVATASGVSTLIGGGEQSASGCFYQPAWDASTSTAYAVDGQNNYTLDQVNVATGASSIVAPFTLDGASLNVDAMAISPTGSAYVTKDSNLYSLNLATGAVTPIGTTGPSDLYGLAFDPRTGVLYALDYNGVLYTIDPATGAATTTAVLSLAPGNNQYSLQVASNGILWIENDHAYGNNVYADLWSVDPTASNIANSAILSGPLTTAAAGMYYSEALLLVHTTDVAPTPIHLPVVSG